MEHPDERLTLEISPALHARMTEIARRFRRTPTASEAILWDELRRRGLAGLKVRRQQPIGPFIVDPYFPEERLVVEIDGGIHRLLNEADRMRQELLEALGLRVMRLNANAVESDVASAIARIQQALKSPLPPAPSPTSGEGE